MTRRSRTRADEPRRSQVGVRSRETTMRRSQMRANKPHQSQSLVGVKSRPISLIDVKSERIKDLKGQSKSVESDLGVTGGRRYQTDALDSDSKVTGGWDARGDSGGSHRRSGCKGRVRRKPPEVGKPCHKRVQTFESTCKGRFSMELGDFNNVLNDEEKSNGLLVTQYEVSDFMECCYDIGISDLRSTGLSSHGLTTRCGALNQQHFSHISARAAAAEEELLETQQQLYDTERCKFLAKAKYLKNCDKGTKFFHDLIKNNRARSQIVEFTKEDGASTISIQQVRSLSVEFYKNLLGVKIDCSRLDREVFVEGKIVDEKHVLSLIQPVSDEEVKSALFSIGDDKTPGPDGYSSCFFKNAWSIVGSDVCAVVKDFFVYGKLLTQLNYAVITLVPKSNSALRVEEFRPIACCNVIYKEYGGKHICGPRAFEEILLEQDFSSIMQCVSTTSYSISINGTLHGFFKGKQGLRQGDPISSFLFVLCLEYLSRKIGRLKSNLDFNFHPKCAALNISHLAFADDLILFTRGDVISMSLIMDCLKKFGECSGLRISDTKCNLFMAGISREIMEEIKTISGFSTGIFPFRYLGIPVAASRLTIEQFNPLIFKISEYITAWAVGVRDKVISLCRNFLWGGKAVVFKKPLVASREICRPKSEGGLGFIDLHAWNLALLSKSLWNLQSKKDSLWVWAEIKSWMGLSWALTTLKASAKWIIKEARGMGVQAVAKKVGFACTVYCIWATRNARMFEGKIIHPMGIIRDIKIQVYRVLHASFLNLQEL
ncbi:hypothetical protein Acr_20g0009890 [Actinidia rufa]|uniref:Reverse transcriptase domain-containing protein n=1 Tax=Actinidia rufa TaxID=165716 RepID=A0A7J0GEI6_9ERIC|nr:hypothetical protein Acr_20g0009890 [Actinidia rufa]